MIRRALLVLALALLSGTTSAFAVDRPNILWITSEDNSPYLGCYGDAQAKTPNLDRLATQSVRYTRAFANAPVCSAARTTLILGMYPPSVGLQHHRSSYRIPAAYRLYGEYLRAAGYFCTNNNKTDYNVALDEHREWDENSAQAHYKNRRPGQPFFAIFNLTTSHESQPANVAQLRKSGKLPQKPRLDPQTIVIPPYHPRTREITEEWANYYDLMTLLDEQVGQKLAELEELGLAEDTIVFYYSDHGGALPRGKRYLYDSGTRVPLLIRFPERWAHLAPGPRGTTVDRLVSFVDFAPTLLSLAGVDIPTHMQGRAFLGSQQQPAEPYVFLFRGRMDERDDFARALRDARYRYVANFTPQLPHGQHYQYPFQMLQSMRSWEQAFREGKCDAAQAAFWQPKAVEELYDVETDPYELQNLAHDPAQAPRLHTMRAALQKKMQQIHDSGYLPEAMFKELRQGGTLAEYVRSPDYPLLKLQELAALATSGGPEAAPRLAAALHDPHPAARYWALQAAVIHGPAAMLTIEKIRPAASDPSAAVRVAAAEALGRLGDRQSALEVLKSELAGSEDLVVLAALRGLDALRPLDPALRPQIQAVLDRRGLSNSSRVANYLLSEMPPAQ